MSIKSVLTEVFTLRRQLKWSFIRSLVLVSSTVILLIARIKVMGAQLPVFTRCVIAGLIVVFSDYLIFCSDDKLFIAGVSVSLKCVKIVSF